MLYIHIYIYIYISAYNYICVVRLLLADVYGICVCARSRACVRAFVCVCMRVRYACVGFCMCLPRPDIIISIINASHTIITR